MMKHYYIQLKKDETMPLAQTLVTKLKMQEDEVKTLIYQGGVWDNNTKVRLKDPDMLVTDAHLLSIYVPEFPIIEYTLKPEDIIYEDEYLTVIYKPKGINTTPSPFSDIDCIIHSVQEYYDKNGIDYVVQPINRLDCPTDGLLVYAKNKQIEIAMHKIFMDRRIRKMYIARTKPFPMKRQTFLFHDMLEWKGKEQEAISYVKFLSETNGMYNFCVYLMTGRTHQIRKHFKRYLNPIIGDSIYGNYKRTDELQLTCYYYRFNHPATGKQLELSIYDRVMDSQAETSITDVSVSNV